MEKNNNKLFASFLVQEQKEQHLHCSVFVLIVCVCKCRLFSVLLCRLTGATQRRLNCNPFWPWSALLLRLGLMEVA